MNRRLCVWVVSILTAFSSLAIRHAAAQAAPAPLAGGIPAGAQGNAVESPSDILAISTFVQTQFNLLAGADPTLQTAARKALIAQLSRGASPAYYTAFSKAWVSDATAGMAKNPSVAVRLNIAIVTATLTDNGLVLNPEPLVVALIGDKEPCVSLWGIKAAKPLIKVILQLPTGAQGPAVLTHSTVGAIVDAVKKNGTSDIAGILVSDAYGALVVKDIPGLNPTQVQALVPPLVGPILDVLEFRLKQLKEGVIPASGGKLGGVQSPGAEKDIGTFLSTNYPGATPANQKRIIQDLVNLLTYIGRRAALYQNNKNDLAQIRDELRYVASPLKVIDQPSATGLTWLLLPPPDCTPDQIVAHTDKVFGIISADPGFKSLVQPPDVVAIEPPPLETPKPTVPVAGGPAGAPLR